MASVEAHLLVMDEAIDAAVDRLETSLSAPIEEAASRFRSRGQLSGSTSPHSQEAVRALILELWESVVRGTMSLPDEDLGLKADNSLRYLEDYIGTFGQRSLERIVQTTENRILLDIGLGQRRGLSTDEIADMLLEDAPTISRARARTIATTEAHAISQYTSQRRAIASGYSLRKQWNSVNDERTRDFGLSGRVSEFNHRVMNGATIPVDGRFLVPRRTGGPEALLFPGDPNGSAGNIINCRCIQTYIRRA